MTGCCVASPQVKRNTPRTCWLNGIPERAGTAGADGRERDGGRQRGRGEGRHSDVAKESAQPQRVGAAVGPDLGTVSYAN